MPEYRDWLTGGMDPDDFRRYGHQIIDWIANYLAHPEAFPAFSCSQPGDIKDKLPAAPPVQAEPMEAILADFENTILPGITHWNHPGFLAYFSSSGSPPGILGELLTSALNVNAMLWRTSPAATELEEVAMDWLRQMLGLPAVFSGIILDGASMSSMTSIAAAREAAGLDIRQRGMAGRDDLPRLRAYTSQEAHSSIEKGALVLGIGQEGMRKIATDDDFAMNAAALRQAIEEDIAAGWRPFYVGASVGTTSTTSIDPIPEIAAICQEYGLWLHVDCAYGGNAAVVPEMRHVLAGVGQADSVVVNPHKWMFTPMDCSAFFVRDPAALRRTFSLIPDYLTSDEGDIVNYMDWGVQLGRRFRALKLWMIIRYYGQDGITQRLREHLALARDLAAEIDQHPDFQRLAPVPFSTICFRFCPADLAARLDSAGGSDAVARIDAYLDALNAQIIDAVNATGEVFFSHTRVRGKYALRLAISNLRTTAETVVRAWELIRDHARRLDVERRPTL